MNAVSYGLRSATSRNGIAVFGIDEQGRFTRRPLWKKVFREFCRLENIHVLGDRAVVTNPDSGCIQVHDLRRDDAFESPLQVVGEPLVFPHGAKMSPDGNLLVVTDFGIEVIDHRVLWKSFVSPRKDRLAVFKLQPA
jgi:6-phosphogluconolactonase (cycloisomerase 2 family)